MTVERTIVQKLFESRKLEEAGFDAGGSHYSAAFGHYSKDGKSIDRDEYFKAKEKSSTSSSPSTEQNSVPRQSHNTDHQEPEGAHSLDVEKLKSIVDNPKSSRVAKIKAKTSITLNDRALKLTNGDLSKVDDVLSSNIEEFSKSAVEYKSLKRSRDKAFKEVSAIEHEHWKSGDYDEYKKDPAYKKARELYSDLDSKCYRMHGALGDKYSKTITPLLFAKNKVDIKVNPNKSTDDSGEYWDDMPSISSSDKEFSFKSLLKSSKPKK